MIGEWTFDRSSGMLEQADSKQRLEPKVADLLALLADRAGTVVSRDEITASLWPDVVVGDDALPRCVSKLRKAFGDDPKQPRYVETVPKRGYRLIASTAPAVSSAPVAGSSGLGTPASSDEVTGPVTASAVSGKRRDQRTTRWQRIPLALRIAFVGGLIMALWHGFSPNESTGGRSAPSEDSPPSRTPAAMLTEQAEDFYFQIDRVGNESAIELYERALAADPDYAEAHAGLANALVQRVLRYPASEDVPPIDPVDLEGALETGRFDTAEARLHLGRALGLAERAVRLEPDNATSHKALGFVRSALGRSDAAIGSYERALALDPDAWDAAINLGDLYEMRGDSERALDYFEKTYAAMNRVYAEQSSRVRPWYARMGISVGVRHEQAGRAEDAESWYRRVLAHSPFDPTATCALARLLRRAGDAPAADRLVEEMAVRTATPVDCDARLAAIEGAD